MSRHREFSRGRWWRTPTAMNQDQSNSVTTVPRNVVELPIFNIGLLINSIEVIVAAPIEAMELLVVGRNGRTTPSDSLPRRSWTSRKKMLL